MSKERDKAREFPLFHFCFAKAKQNDGDRSGEVPEPIVKSRWEKKKATIVFAAEGEFISRREIFGIFCFIGVNDVQHYKRSYRRYP